MDSDRRPCLPRNQSPVLGDKTLPVGVRRNGEVTAGLLTLDNGKGDRIESGRASNRDRKFLKVVREQSRERVLL